MFFDTGISSDISKNLLHIASRNNKSKCKEMKKDAP